MGALALSNLKRAEEKLKEESNSEEKIKKEKNLKNQLDLVNKMMNFLESGCSSHVRLEKVVYQTNLKSPKWGLGTLKKKFIIK